MYTSHKAHNHSGLSVEKHSNNFVVSNDVLVLEVCKQIHGCRNSKRSYQGISMVVTVVQHVHYWHVLTIMLRSLIVDIVILKISTKFDQMIFLLIS